ncbi:carboxynorspermidine decarboxylase [Deinococcus radiophilus]|uniref:Carboxynorspermidine decarboxylase n=1 Tax=Deinococcus radiophilus TaxID=32062 RepID=A0A3S0I7L8_9DEIO|nr:carboxynorspermidine decarboxylase [Deinococcus radiophilus]RTR27057.1 carboxynorspermidine decarboxylase [Deinococcus radiophilus]UFA50161.1 carboxynorspermidine decarboxylase [Deinococcus radiophilus]
MTELPADLRLPDVTDPQTVNWAEIPSPAFVLDETRLRRNLALISYVQEKSGAQIIVAFKGFSMWSTFPILREYGISGATASSLNEVILADEEMQGEVHAYAPAYSDEDFPEILRRSDHIVFNSLAQWERFRPQVEAARQGGRTIHAGLRVNPEYAEVETDLYNPAGPFSRLGVTRREFPDTLPEGIDGLHFHTLCEKDSDTLERTLEVLEEKFGEFLASDQVAWVNFGGGHLMTREGYDIERLIRVVRAFRERWNVHVILEPGSAFGWQTGWLVSSVLDVVHNVKDAVLLDVSVSAHMPDVLEMPYRPRILGAGDPPDDTHREADAGASGHRYIIGGTTCLAGDVVGEYVFPEPLKVGDRVVFDDMIHYTMVKTTFFNGVKHPDIGILHADGSYERVKVFGYDEFKAKLS